MTTSLAARCIAERIIPQIREKALVAGLLHDIGKLAMNGLIDLKLEVEIQDRLEQGQSLDKIEREIFGIDHCEAGCLFAEKWSFPDEIRCHCHHHHPAQAADHRHLVYLIQVADKLSHALSAGIKISEFLEIQLNGPDWEASIEPLGISREDAESLFSDIHAELKSTEAFLDM